MRASGTTYTRKVTVPTPVSLTKVMGLRGPAIAQRSAPLKTANAKGSGTAHLVAKKTVAAVTKEKVERVIQPICPELKKDGTPCTAHCMEGTGTCVDHRAAWDRLSDEEKQNCQDYVEQMTGEDLVELIGWWKAKKLVTPANRLPKLVKGGGRSGKAA